VFYSGVQNFFYGQSCITGFSRAQLDDALSPLEFSIPDINGKVTQVGFRVCSIRLRSHDHVACSTCWQGSRGG